MADPIPNAPPTTDIPQTPGAPTQVSIEGTNINVPVGSGVEQIITVNAPFSSQSPPWYTPPGTVWSQTGCAVPQSGPQIDTNNSVIYDLVKFCGRGLFDVLWYNGADRLGEGWPQKRSLWEMHSMLVTARSRLQAITNPPGANPLTPGKAGAAPTMWLVYPVPFYGRLGCVNQYFRTFALLTMRAMSDAMQHGNNGLDFYVDKTFFSAIYPYIQYLMVQMATKFFGEDATAASDPAYVIPAAKWAAYDPATQAVSFEATSATPPLNYVSPNPNDLQKICGLTYEAVTPFLQQWPDAAYKMISGGIWSSASSPAVDPTGKAGLSVSQGTSAGASNPALFTTNGPPTA